MWFCMVFYWKLLFLLKYFDWMRVLIINIFECLGGVVVVVSCLMELLKNNGIKVKMLVCDK